MQDIELSRIIESAVTSMGYEFVGLEQIMSSPVTVKVYVDKPGGIDLDSVARVSRQLSAALHAEDLMQVPYVLEVSSPGIERPLFTPHHFIAQIGKKIAVKLHVPVDGKRKVIGVLRKVDGMVVSVDLVDEARLVEVEFNNISKAKLVYDDLKIGKGKRDE